MTVYPPGTIPKPGTILWSDPVNAGVVSLVPAVPSVSGVADVFALDGNCNVWAVASDGTEPWMAKIGQLPLNTGNFNAVCSQFVPDFQGGIEVLSESNASPGSLYPFYYSLQKFDGITGQAYPAFSQSVYWENMNWQGHFLAPTGPNFPPFVVHTEGPIFTVLDEGPDVFGNAAGFSPPGVAVINPLTGQTMPVAFIGDEFPRGSSYTQFGFGGFGSWIVAGDGYAYIPVAYQASSGPQPPSTCLPNGNGCTVN